MGGHVQEETIAILQIAKRFVETEEDQDLRLVMTVLFLGLLFKLLVVIRPVEAMKLVGVVLMDQTHKFHQFVQKFVAMD